MLDKKVIKGSFVLLIAFGLFNIFNFAYQIAMARLLSVEEYGVLATLFAIIYIFAIFSESIQTVIAKYTVESKSYGQLRNMLRKSIKRGTTVATKLFIGYLLISILFSYFFNISYLLLALNGIVIYFMFLLPVSRGALQGRKQFLPLGVNLVIESVMKLILGICFVLIGWKVYGAIGGFIVGALIAFLLSFVSLKEVYRAKEEKFEGNGIYSYAKPTFFITAVIVLFYSVDVIIAKILFVDNDYLAGAYATASILGKIILWASVPIGKAMFPLSAESKDNGERKNKILVTTLVLLSCLIIGMLGIFYLFSEEIVRLFSNKEIVESAKILVYLGISFSLIAVSNIILLYQLSIGKIKRYKVLIICNLIEVLLLVSSGNSLERFSISFVISSIILLVGSILFVWANRHV